MKREQFVIYSTDTPALVVLCVSTKGDAMLTTSEIDAMKFPSQIVADQFILSLDEPLGFFGTRPVGK